MSRLIDADMLIPLLEQQYEPINNNYPMTFTLKQIADALADIPTIGVEPEMKWISVAERLPKQSDKWEMYIVNVIRSHYPTSSYDSCDAPYTEDIVVSAMYDSKQKIWHLEWDEQLNALIDIDDSPFDGDFVSHWMPMPNHA